MWEPEPIWRRFFEDPDLISVRDLMAETMMPRSTLYYVLALHPDYKRLKAERDAKRLAAGIRHRRRRRDGSRRSQMGGPR